MRKFLSSTFNSFYLWPPELTRLVPFPGKVRRDRPRDFQTDTTLLCKKSIGYGADTIKPSSADADST